MGRAKTSLPLIFLLLDDDARKGSTMRNAIEHELDLLSAVRDVNVLVAVESGSRAWGIASRDSDYDVRFVYTRPVDEYLRLKESRDTMNWRLDETLDTVGWLCRSS